MWNKTVKGFFTAFKRKIITTQIQKDLKVIFGRFVNK
jgi:hypothetical protein